MVFNRASLSRAPMSAVSERDLHIKTDVVSALKAFATTREQQEHWNGFAIYCMEIAAGFMHAYKQNTGREANGQKPAELAKLSDLTELSEAKIQGFVSGSKVHDDITKFVEAIGKGDQNKMLQEESERKAKELKKMQKLLDDEKKRNSEALSFLKDKMDESVRSMEKFAEEQEKATKNANYIESTMTAMHKAYMVSLSNLDQIMRNLEHELKNAAPPEQIERMVQNIAFFVKGIDIESQALMQSQLRELGEKNTALEQVISDLKQEKEALNAEISKLKTQLESTGAGFSLSENTVSILQDLYDLIQKFYEDDEIEMTDPNLSGGRYSDFTAIASDLSSMPDEASNLTNILSFTRSALVFFVSALHIHKAPCVMQFDKNFNKTCLELLDNTQLQSLFFMLYGYLDGEDYKKNTQMQRNMKGIFEVDVRQEVVLALRKIKEDQDATPSNCQFVISSLPENETTDSLNKASITTSLDVFNQLRFFCMCAFTLHLYEILQKFTKFSIEYPNHIQLLAEYISVLYPDYIDDSYTENTDEIYKYFLDGDKHDVKPMHIFHQGFQMLSTNKHFFKVNESEFYEDTSDVHSFVKETLNNFRSDPDNQSREMLIHEN